jgi:hypothetical protein
MSKPVNERMTAQKRINRTPRTRIVARPGIIAGMPDHPRTHRIVRDSATAREKIGFAVNRRRAIAPLNCTPATEEINS